LAELDPKRIDFKKAVLHLLEGRSARIRGRRPVYSSTDEWLGGESHVPNLGLELRRRSGPDAGLTVVWIAGALFAAGMAVGGLAAVLLARSKRTR